MYTKGLFGFAGTPWYGCNTVAACLPWYSIAKRPLKDEMQLVMASSFRADHPFETRKGESARIREKYPDRIPVIVEKADESDVPDIDRKKYLVPTDLSVGQFVYVIRKRIKLGPEKSIYIFVKNVLPPTCASMSALYNEHKDDDGFLYIKFSGENYFGL